VVDWLLTVMTILNLVSNWLTAAKTLLYGRFVVDWLLTVMTILNLVSNWLTAAKTLLYGRCIHLLISAPRRVYYFLSLTQWLCLSVPMSVCLSVTPLPIDFSFLFLDGIEPFLAISSPCGTLQNVVLKIFDLGPLTPKIYSQNLHEIAYNSACMADRPEMFGPIRGFLGMADSMEPCKML